MMLQYILLNNNVLFLLKTLITKHVSIGAGCEARKTSDYAVIFYILM